MHQIIRVLLLVLPILALIPMGPIEASPNTENSLTMLLLPFQLALKMPKSGYLLVTMPNYLTAVTPTSCKLVNTTIVLECTNFQTPLLTGLTVTSASMALTNPNINAMLSVIIRSDTALVEGTTYYLQVALTNVIPSTSRLSDSFEFYSISYNGIIYEQNWNFGQVLYQDPQTNNLAVSNLTSLITVLPSTTSTLQVSITIGVNVASTKVFT